MTREERIRETLARSDFLFTRLGLVRTEDLRRFIPPSTVPVTLAKEQTNAD